jgi:hypothetical protein
MCSASYDARGNEVAFGDLTDYGNMKIGVGRSHATDVLLGGLDIMPGDEFGNPFDITGIHDLFEISANE